MIGPKTTLRELAFIVCTALDRVGVTAVLSGGGAATVYAPEAYQSHDLDFIFSFWSTFGPIPEAPLLDLGFRRDGGTYMHGLTPYTVEFPKGPLAVGEEEITTWSTLREEGLLLHVLTPTDCVRDRLAWFFFGRDYSAMLQAAALTLGQAVDMEKVEKWSHKEGEGARYEQLRLHVTRAAEAADPPHVS